MAKRRALITGITGQDGSYLVDFLVAKGYEVHGIIRRSSTFNTSRLNRIRLDQDGAGKNLTLHFSDLAEDGQLTNLIYNVEPAEIYHLGAQSHVKVSFEIPAYTGDVTGVATTRVLEAVRRSGIRARFYQASSSEMFGAAKPPQNENTPFHPASPYGAAKVHAYWITRIYREAYGMFASNGILFNHESPRRGETFVTRKITLAVAAIVKGTQQHLHLGNLEARRDWGYAPEYVQGIWRVIQHGSPGDFVIGTGETHSVREFAKEAFAYVDRDWRDYVRTDRQYLRPLEVHDLRADARKAARVLRWKPRIAFRDLVHIMLDADLEAAGLPCPGKGKAAAIAACGRWWE